MSQKKDKMISGTVYANEELEHIGVMPVRQDIKVLPADDPKRLKLGWVIHEYNGAEVFPLTADGEVVEEPITQKDGISEGMKVSAWGRVWAVKASLDGLHLDGGQTIGTLSFAEDDRKCWVCSGLINKRAIGRVSKTTIVG